MARLLVAAFGHEGLPYVDGAERLNIIVRVLDCFDEFHQRLQRLYGDIVLHAPGTKHDVAQAVAKARFDVAVVHEDAFEFVRSALIVQSLCDSGIRHIVVVTANKDRIAMYRRIGANRVIVASSAEEAWPKVEESLPSFASA